MLIAVFAFVAIATAQAQIQTKIIGKWKVVGTESNKDGKLNKDEEKELKTLSKAGLEFKSDGHAKFKQIFSSFNIPDGFWEYNKEKDVIIISDWDNRNRTLMRLWYEEMEDGKIKFFVDETPYILIAQKD